MVTSEITETVAQRCSVKKVFLKISQNSQENTCTRVSFLIKLQRPTTSLKQRLWHRSFPVNFAKFLRTPIFIEHLWWLLLKLSLLLIHTCHSACLNLSNRDWKNIHIPKDNYDVVRKEVLFLKSHAA